MWDLSQGEPGTVTQQLLLQIPTESGQKGKSSKGCLTQWDLFLPLSFRKQSKAKQVRKLHACFWNETVAQGHLCLFPTFYLISVGTFSKQSFWVFPFPAQALKGKLRSDLSQTTQNHTANTFLPLSLPSPVHLHRDFSFTVCSPGKRKDANTACITQGHTDDPQI